MYIWTLTLPVLEKAVLALRYQVLNDRVKALPASNDPEPCKLLKFRIASRFKSLISPCLLRSTTTRTAQNPAKRWN
jgi:hypothetical protein